jgi:hypothetical protein
MDCTVTASPAKLQLLSRAAAAVAAVAAIDQEALESGSLGRACAAGVSLTSDQHAPSVLLPVDSAMRMAHAAKCEDASKLRSFLVATPAFVAATLVAPPESVASDSVALSEPPSPTSPSSPSSSFSSSCPSSPSRPSPIPDTLPSFGIVFEM